MRVSPEDIQTPNQFDHNGEAIAWYLYYVAHLQVIQTNTLDAMETRLYEIWERT